ncbi:metabotropic glutamate receptor-like [Octopus vulgaris]|uniref:Metabotropic glutamate receptor-like n=2 Tax=Octopus vulgaris TaxID=6645 RepID=A0AA36AQE3_OCTVU|nr:metabotropic glutamate receptor-like [Octopus vulgaris]
MKTKRKNMKKSQRRCLLVVAFLVCCLQFSASALNETSHEPVFDVQPYNGSTTLVLLDINQKLNTNGSCSQPDIRSLLVAYSALWTHEYVNIASSQTNRGLKVFDCCSSPKRAVDILLSEIKGHGCSTTINGIVIFTSLEVFSEMKNYLQRFQIPQVIIWGELQKPPNPTPFQTIIRLKSIKKSKALVELSQSLDWSYINTRVSASADALEEYKSFLEQVALSETKICISMEEPASINQQSQSSTVLFFNNGLTNSGQHEAAMLSDATSKITLFISDSNSDLKQIVLNATTNGLLLREDLPPLKNFPLADVLVNRSNLMIDQAGEISRHWLTQNHFCKINNDVLGNCDIPNIQSVLSEALNLKSIHGVIKAIKMLSGDSNVTLNDSTTANNNVTNITRADDSWNDVFKMSNIENIWEMNTDFSLFATVGPVFEKVGQINGSFYPLDKTRWRLISEKLHGSNCPSYCPACIQCSHNRTELSVSKFEEGDFYVALVLPVQKSLICDETNHENELLVDYFLKSLRQIKEKPSTATGNKLGGIVIDSCHSQSDSENMCYSFIDKNGIKRVITSGNLLSTIHVPNLSKEPYQEHPKRNSLLPSIHITKIGCFFDNLNVQKYVSVILDVMESLRWSYLTILLSENPFMKAIHKDLSKQAKMKNMCIRNVILIEDLRRAQLLNQNNLFSEQDSSALVLLTDLSDTSEFLHSISKHYGSSHVFNFVFFPWNSKAISNLGSNLFQSSVFIEVNNPKSYEISRNVTSLNVSELESQLEMCHLSPSGKIYCPAGKIVKKSQKSVFFSYLTSVLEVTATALDQVSSKLCSGKKGLCNEFLEWPNVMSNFRHFLKTSPVFLFGEKTHFDENGALEANFAMKNLRRIGDEFEWIQVGQYTINRNISLFKKSVRGYNALQDVKAPVSECNGWCPQCYQCDNSPGKTIDINNDFIYMPGDILITAMMPVRKAGRTIFECGDVTIDSDVDQLIEAVIYAVKTAKQRHNSLLKDIDPGLLILDTCSSKQKALTILGNFESCAYSLRQNSKEKSKKIEKNEDYYSSWGASPKLTPAYMAVGSSDVLDILLDSVADFKKPVMAIDKNGGTRRAQRDSDLHETTLSMTLSANARFSAMIGLINAYRWNHVFVVASDSPENHKLIQLFSDMTRSTKICILHIIWLKDILGVSYDDLSPNNETNSDDPFLYALKLLATDNTTKLIIAFISEDHFTKLNSLIKKSNLSVIWFFDQSPDGWERHPLNTTIPAGAFTIDRATQVYTEFEKYYNSSLRGTDNVWFSRQRQKRSSCQIKNNSQLRKTCLGKGIPADQAISPVTTDVIRATDAILFALQREYLDKCGGKGGLCKEFNSRNILTLDSFKNIEVEFESDSFQFDESREVVTSIAIYSRILNENNTKIIKVAEWKDDTLFEVIKTTILLNDNFGDDLDKEDVRLMMEASCEEKSCTCANMPPKPTPSMKSTMALTLRDEGFVKSTGQFRGTIWATVVITVAAAGVLTAIGIFTYLLYKYCLGTGCGRRYCTLALILLFALVVQYSTILPFVFTPNELVCEMRYFAPAFGYAFTLSIILVKLMNLHDYRLIGLGGTLSIVNQLLTIVFITGIQVAVGLQRWLLKKSALAKMVTYYGVSIYSCLFDKYDFIYYICYPMFLQILILLYAISLYKEKRNLREAKYILLACVFSIVVWLAWQLVYFLQPSKFMQPAVAIGILIFTTVNLSLIFIPKIHMMATLRYDVNKTSQDHYSTKADSDFFFERPFSLPGTLKTSVSEKTYARSYDAFENSNYSSGSV